MLVVSQRGAGGAYSGEVLEAVLSELCTKHLLCCVHDMVLRCDPPSRPHGGSYTGVYWSGFYDGPLTAVSSFAHAWMLQLVSGLGPPAWGLLSRDEIEQLYAVHERVMWLGSHLNRSVR